MKAIQTIYNGYKFRSRLEARWAVFFDEMGIEYQYEPEGFEKDFSELHGVEFVVRYLPDFYLPKLNLWVEVKGGALSREDSNKMEKILNYQCEIPGVFNSHDPASNSIHGGLLLLGDIPNTSNVLRYPVHTIIQEDNGLIGTYVMFCPLFEKLIKINDKLAELLGLPQNDWFGDVHGDDFRNNFRFGTLFIDCKAYYPRVIEAYTKARQARFEHGETP